MDFLVENWKLIVVLAAIIIDLVLVLIFKRRPTIVDTSIVYRVAEWIEYAEKHYQVGEAKLFYVLKQAQSYLGDNYDEHQVTQLVEWILSLPQKKGVDDEK